MTRLAQRVVVAMKFYNILTPFIPLSFEGEGEG